MVQKLKAGRDQTKPSLFVYSFGLLLRRRIRDILRANGWVLRFGIPSKQRDTIGVWGRKNTFKRGAFMARLRKVPLITIEDGFLRSVKTGRQGAKAHSIILDKTGIYFETNKPNDLRDFIEQSSQITPRDIERAQDGIAVLKKNHLSKYNAHTADGASLPEQFVLVVDQTKGDASVTLGGADEATFQDMLDAARSEHPNSPIIIKTHPETVAGKREGYFKPEQLRANESLLAEPVSPWLLFERAHAVYCVTSQMGMEAIFAQKRPVVFGQAFYAGWGLTDDRHPQRQALGIRTKEQLFWAAYQRYTRWYDPYFDRVSDFFTTARIITARKRAWALSHKPVIALNIRLWKRGFFRKYLAYHPKSPRFIRDMDKALEMATETGGSIHVWASGAPDGLFEKAAQRNIPVIRMEDGFLRSGGLGAALVRPCSLAFDDVGIYFDPFRESRLERLIKQSVNLSRSDVSRANKLRMKYIKLGLSKYNLDGETVVLSPEPKQKVILIPGQVENDASVVRGGSDIKTNEALIWATRQLFPRDYLVYKPHPDVEAGLRPGVVARDVLNGVVDKIVDNGDISELLNRVDQVSTISSLTGFEALMRGKTVICFGSPFYAGWGLTKDQKPTPKRRNVTPSLDQMVHAALIDYPLYWDPVTGEPCPVETIMERFEKREFGQQGGFGLRLLAKLQGLFASYAYLWR